MTLGRRAGMDVSIPWDARGLGRARRAAAARRGVDGGRRRSLPQWDVPQRRAGRGRQRLRPGDRLLVGRTVIAYCQNAAESSEKTVDSGTLPELPSVSETQHRILVALCRPYGEGGQFPVPASNQQIARRSSSVSTRSSATCGPCSGGSGWASSAEPEASTARRARVAAGDRLAARPGLPTEALAGRSAPARPVCPALSLRRALRRSPRGRCLRP